MKMAVIRIRDIEESLTKRKEKITEAVASVGGCTPVEVSVGNFSDGPRRSTEMLARCPLAAAIKATATERIQIGCVQSRVELLAARPLICFKCSEREHVRNPCRSSEDRSSYCYRCGDPRPRAKECTGQPSCRVCEKACSLHNHKVGGPACKSRLKKWGKKGSKRKKGEEKEAPLPKTPVEDVGVSPHTHGGGVPGR